MTAALSQSSTMHITAKAHPLTRVIWSRRDYHERLNLRRIMSRHQEPESLFVPHPVTWMKLQEARDDQRPTIEG